MDKKTSAVNQNSKLDSSMENQIEKSIQTSLNTKKRKERAEFYKAKYAGTDINNKKN